MKEIYIHTLHSMLGKHTYKVEYVGKFDKLPGDRELGVVFPMDDWTSGVYSIKSDIDPDIIPMLKAGRALAETLSKQNG